MKHIARHRYAPLIADVVSWGYAVIVMLVVLNTPATYTIVDAAAIAALFLVLRAVAREIRRESHRTRRRAERPAGIPARV